jgi:hypothetical protein
MFDLLSRHAALVQPGLDLGPFVISDTPLWIVL